MGVVACGNPAVARPHAAAERVRCLVEPARGEVKAYRRRGGLAEDLLAVDRVIAFENLTRRPTARRHNGADQRHKFLPEGGEGLRYLLSGRARFVLVEESIIRNIPIAD